MNEKLSFIFKRRSIRKYTQKSITDAEMTDLLQAAMAAPSAVAKDPWRFITIRDPKRLSEAAEHLPNGGMLRSAGAGILVCGDLNAAHDGELGYLVQDCSASVENILLAVEALGLGAVWLGVYPREDRMKNLAALFNLPENVIPVAMISIGEAAEKKSPRTRFIKGYIHSESW